MQQLAHCLNVVRSEIVHDHNVTRTECRHHGKDFCKLFKSITVDNGSE